MKDAFYFTSKALFVLKIFKFFSWLFGRVAKRLHFKVNFKIFDATAWLTIVIHILPSISRSKDHQTVKFGQLIDYNMRNIFLEKSYTKCGGETSPRTYFEKLKVSISLDQ